MDSLKKLKVAILGATGYIGRALLDEYLKDEGVAAVGYSRDAASARNVLSRYKITNVDIRSYEDLRENEYDVIINATGIGSPKKLAADPDSVFVVTEEMDKVVCNYLNQHPNTRAFNLSSGAVYGQSAAEYVNVDTKAAFAVNTLSVKDGYAVAKLHSEVRHRAMKDMSIIDLRVFAFVSRYLDPDDSFLVSDIAKCLKEKSVLKTKPDDMVRDFTTAKDIKAVISFLMERAPMNEVFDMKSGEDVGKFQLLGALQKELGLSFAIEERSETSPTGTKNVYAPKESRLESLGFKPVNTSLDNVMTELKAFLAL